MNSIVKFIGNCIIKLWCAWSSIRYKNAIKDYDIQKIDEVNTISDIRLLVRRLYNKFKYTADDISELYDAINSPAQCYKDCVEDMLKDDCDGFHSAVYHCLTKNNIECYVLCVNTISIKHGHCICVFKCNDKWYINDYTMIYKGYPTLIDAIENYNNIFPTKYRTKYKVIYNALLKYDYKYSKFKLVDIK